MSESPLEQPRSRFDWKGIRLRDRHISRAESVHRAFCMAALEQMIGLAGWRWLQAGQHSPALHVTPVRVNGRERACPAWFPRCPTRHETTLILLFAKTSVCPPRCGIISPTWEKFICNETCTYYIYLLENIINLDVHFESIYISKNKKEENEKRELMSLKSVSKYVVIIKIMGFTEWSKSN